ncbi:transmembrane protein 26-like [Mercenaria mercenaria]|uniref:transmembrane protein 26-like n=1 Tax=Mercenaria mercenaria TaxID=6596 RepID=UPI00234E59FE|nr:transmembrane protein 26-like [Mercenaria mercenaria]
MGHLSVARAFSVRLLFASHGVVSIWRLANVTDENKFWYLAGTLVLLFLEAMVTLVKRQGKEWKWFCPSVFIYLLTSVPAIWFLELHEFDKRAQYIEQAKLLSQMSNETIYFSNGLPELQEDLSSPIGSILGVKFEVRIPIKLTPDQWIRMLEQMLLLILILGRWLLPKGKLTHDQLSQLLLVYIGTAADIVEFFEAFKEKEVRNHKILCIIILGIWSTSLVQFSLVLTASRARKDRSTLYMTKSKGSKRGCCHADVFGILISIILQDLPFLVLRMLLIFKYNVLSYTNMFFTSKNTLVIALLMYRLVVLFINRNEPEKEISVETVNGDISSIPESSTFRKTSEIRKKLLEYHVSENFDHHKSRPSSKEYEVIPEKHKWGRSYHFELMQI